MNKKLAVMFGTAVLVVAMAAVTFAGAPDNNTTRNDGQRSFGYGVGCCGMGESYYGFMMDDNGKRLGRDAFTQKLDKAIKDQKIDSRDRDTYIRMYERHNDGYSSGNGMRMGGYGSQHPGRMDN